VKLHTGFIARGLAIVWAVFWLFFFIVESWVWHTPPLIAAPWVGAGFLFVVLALVPWHWERGGGRLLVAVGVLLGVAYAIWAPAGLSIASRATTIMVLSGPPILAGLLFLRQHGT
jgi:hypothetical protein